MSDNRKVYKNVSMSRIKNCYKLEGEVTICYDRDFMEISISGIPLKSFDKIISCMEKEVEE